MSAEFYFSKGYTPRCWSATIAGPDTYKIVNPGAGKRVVFTNISISSNVGGTIAFYFEGNNRIAQFNRQASATINPHISAWENTTVGEGIFAVLKGTATDGCYVNAEGFLVD
jgi:hypothetical protein